MHLKNVEETISQTKAKIIEETDKGMQFINMKTELSEPDIKMEKPASDREGQIAVGKSGRIYTEAELELQIRD